MHANLLDEIAERLAKATGPDPILDALVKLAFRPPPACVAYEDIAEIELLPKEEKVRFTLKKLHPEFGKPYHGDWHTSVAEPVTSSLDAAVGLICSTLGSAWGRRLAWDGSAAHAELVGYAGLGRYTASASTEPLALLRAFMAAWAQQKTPGSR